MKERESAPSFLQKMNVVPSFLWKLIYFLHPILIFKSEDEF